VCAYMSAFNVNYTSAELRVELMLEVIKEECGRNLAL